MSYTDKTTCPWSGVEADACEDPPVSDDIRHLTWHVEQLEAQGLIETIGVSENGHLMQKLTPEGEAEADIAVWEVEHEAGSTGD